MSCRVDRFLAPLIVLALWNPPCPGDEPGLMSPSGTVRLAPGITAHYSWSYYNRDRNALADAVRAGDAIIALTDSGALVRFDASTLKLAREWSGPVGATCLGHREGDAVLAGYADGRVGRIDPATLAMTELARLPGEVQWVGTIPAGAGQAAKPRIIGVMEQKKEFETKRAVSAVLGRSRGAVVEKKKVVEIKSRKYQVPCSVVIDLGSGKTFAPDARGERPSDLHASAFLLDHKHRLWLGADNGEWGGWCSYVDLDAGQVHSVPGKIDDLAPEPSWPGVYGFTELRDGQVWAYGGTMHMGGVEGFIWRVDRGKAEELHRLDNGLLIRRQMAEMRKAAGIEEPAAKAEPRLKPEPPFPTDRPFLPITHVLEDSGTGAIVVVAFSEVYRTDARLARWDKFHELTIGYRSGRPDAVGAYPAVRSVLPMAEPGKPMGLLFVTQLDGLVRLVDGKLTRSTPLAQLAIEATGRIAASSEGILLFARPGEGWEEEEIWRYRDGTWSPVSFAPPFQRHPDAPEAGVELKDADWATTNVMVGRDGSIATVSAFTAHDESTRTTARWRDGKAEVLGREVSTLLPAASFGAPDGQLWNAENSILRHFVDGRWVDVDAATDPRGVRRADWNGIDLRLVTVNDAGPPWILRDRRNEMLLRLAYGPVIKDPRLELIPLTEAGRRLKVLDAIAWNKGELLLATDRGLWTFAIDGGKLSTPTLNTGGRVVTHLLRDGRGRLWLGGEGLAVLEADGKTLHPLDELPMLGRSQVEAIAADPSHPDGAIAAVADRGVVFVRVDAR